MFEHSVRVPRHFKIAANIVQKVSEEGGSVKTLLYDSKLKHFRTNVLYALINESIKHAVDITKMFESTGILVNEPRLDQWLARVLTAELIYGKKSLPGKSKPEQTILSYRERFEKFTTEVEGQSKVVPRPRYVRINTNLLTTSDAIRVFQDEGYKFIRCTSGSYNDYLQQIQNLTEYDFTQDYHVKTIFVFPPGTKFHDHDLYLENKIILQDKATALAVHLLAAPTGSVVLDMCAAPGMKTTQLAAYLRNQGKIYAVERNEKRYETLCQYVEATASKCVETLHKDSLEIRRGDLDDVEYILLDPSCSGSGMELSVHNYIDETRLAKLTSLQEKFLKHAMNSFPNAKRIVYSTCSIFPEENERVVTNIVKASRARWIVKDIKELLKEQWNNYGSGMYGSMGTRCIYAKPDTDFTIGFFMAVLDRDLRDNEKHQGENKIDNDLNKPNPTFKDNRKQQEGVDSVNNDQYETKVENMDQLTKKNKKDKSNDIQSINDQENAAYPEKWSEEITEENNIPKRKKKKRNLENEIIDISEEKQDISKKKKFKSNVNDESDVMITDISIDIEEVNADLKSKERSKNVNIPKESSDEIRSDTMNNEKKNKSKNIEILEISQKNNSVESSDQTEIPKKKKNKKREREYESLETVKVKHISADTENKNNPDTNLSLENKLKKKKKLKDYENVTLESETVTIINISSDGDLEEHSKKRNKIKSHNETSVILEIQNGQLKSSDDIPTLSSDQLYDDAYKNCETTKTKKKKQKLRNEGIEELDTIIIGDSNTEGEKKSKKKKKDRKHVNNSDILLCDLTQESNTPESDIEDGTKRKKSESIDLEIREKKQTCKAPKKKNKRRDLEIS